MLTCSSEDLELIIVKNHGSKKSKIFGCTEIFCELFWTNCLPAVLELVNRLCHLLKCIFKMDK